MKTPMKTALRLTALLLVLFALSPAHAQFSVYTDRAAWEAAVGSFTQESFDEVSLNGFTIIELEDYTGHAHGVADGFYEDRVVDPNSYTIFSFENPTFAFGA